MSKARGFLTKAKQCEERAKKVRDLENKDWRIKILGRAYRMLAAAESEAAAQKNNRTNCLAWA